MKINDPNGELPPLIIDWKRVYEHQREVDGFNNSVEGTPLTKYHEVWPTIGKYAGIVGRLALKTSLGLVCSIASLKAFGATEGQVGPAKVTAEMTASLDGRAEISLPPIGKGWFDVSKGPLGMRFELNQLDQGIPEIVKKELQAKSPNKFVDTSREDLEQLRNKAIGKGSLLLLAGGAFGVLSAEALLRINKEKYTKKDLLNMGIRGAVIPLGMLIASSTLTLTTYDKDAFDHPHFDSSGSLERVVNFANSTLNSVDKYKRNSQQLLAWAKNLSNIQKNLDVIPSSSDLIPVLAISDVHGRPCSYDRAEQLIKSFSVEFVINTGDETEWGHVFEDPLFSSQCKNNSMASLKLPVIFVPGNHDSPSSVAEYKKLSNVIIPTGDTIKVPIKHGNKEVVFRILAAPDPLYTPDFVSRPDKKTEDNQVKLVGSELGYQALIDKPDIIAVHEPMAVRSALKVLGQNNESLILAGHTHKFTFDKKNSWVTLGSFGGSGLRSYEQITSSERSTTEAAILYFDPSTRKLVSVLDLRVQNDGSISSQMHNLNKPKDSPQSANDILDFLKK